MEQLTKNTVKLVQSLSKKKERDELGLFLAEGPKLVGDLSSAFSCYMLIATSDYLAKNVIKSEITIVVSSDDLKKVSQLCAPQSVVAVFRKPSFKIDYQSISERLTLMLDTVQDPGNLGTIIRVADWYGIEDIVCSKETVDVFNPKVVQATMGALSRVKVHYTNLVDCLRHLPSEVPVYGTFLEGNDIYKEPITEHGIIVMGNEGNGISMEVKPFITNKLYIPNYPQSRETSESLNVAIATAITCSEFRRRVN